MLSEKLAAPLTAEDQQVQSMPDVSPTKWHLAHVTWFFETFVLRDFASDYALFHPDFPFLFNSYYESAGPRHTRAARGLLTRPTIGEVLDYRRHVDEAIEKLFAAPPPNSIGRILELMTLGLNHEEQHQELLLMDIKHVFSCNPLSPAYKADPPETDYSGGLVEWLEVEGGIREIGHEGGGFAFDNEGPRHEVLLRDFRIASRLVTNGEFLEFVKDGGYEQAEHWFMDGIETVRREKWRGPLYWRPERGDPSEFTLNGLRPLDLDAPVCHVSYYEAAAYASWVGRRLPSEAEWEAVAADRVTTDSEVDANVLGSGRLHPAPAKESEAAARRRRNPLQIIGDVWEWTQSAYGSYPGFKPAGGAIGEYNGKFMANQMVLRGGCCVTPVGHTRTTYRNFFYPHQRWMFSGIRLAADA